MTGGRFFGLRLWTSIECAYRVTIVLIYLNVLFIFITWSSSFVSKLFIDGGTMVLRHLYGLVYIPIWLVHPLVHCY